MRLREAIFGMRARLIWAGIGISAGLMAGTVFWIRYQNYLATSIAFFSSICALFLFYVHFAYHKSWFNNWSKSRIQMIVIINTVICLLGIAGMVVCLVLAWVWDQGLSADDLRGNNIIIAAVWCWMTFKWTIASAIYTRRYEQEIAKSNEPTE